MKKSALYALAGTTIAILIGIVTTYTTSTTSTTSTRVIITQSGTIYDCEGESIRGITVSAENVTVTNCQIVDAVGTGIEVHGKNNTLENITIDGVTISDNDVDGVRFFGSGHVFRNISVRNIQCVAPAHCDGFQTWGDAYHVAAHDITFDGVEVYNFNIYGTSPTWAKSQCFMIESDSTNASNVAYNITIKNSILNCFRTANIGDSDDIGITHDISFFNNTIVGKIPVPVTGENSGEWGIFCTNCINVIVQENIFYNIAGQHLLEVTTARNNLVYREDGGRLYEPKNAGDLWGVNPLFVDPANGDYRLSVNSPARGQADDGGDLGAFQFDEFE